MKAIRGQRDKEAVRKVVAYALVGAMAFGGVPTAAFATDELQGQPMQEQSGQPS